MARVSTTGGWSHSTDAGFRAWVAEFINMLTGAGLVRTSDTGQVNEASVNRPSTNAWAGYAIFRFNDALQATAPIYLRIQFGTGSSGAYPGISIQMGTGTNGAGTLTGLVTQEHIIRANSFPGTATDYPSRAVHTAGFAAIAFKIGGLSATSHAGLGFIVQRTVNSSGSPTAEGAMLIGPPAGTGSATSHGQMHRLVFSTALAPDPISTEWLGRAHGALADSRVGLSPQAFHHWIALPKIKPLIGSIGFLRGEVPLLAEASLAMVGTTPRNYLCLGQHFGNVLSAVGNSDVAILWED